MSMQTALGWYFAGALAVVLGAEHFWANAAKTEAVARVTAQMEAKLKQAAPAEVAAAPAAAAPAASAPTTTASAAPAAPAPTAPVAKPAPATIVAASAPESVPMPIAAPKAAPRKEAPLDVSVQQDFSVGGRAAVVANHSPKALAYRVKLSHAGTASKVMQAILNPGDVRKIGKLDGWTFAAGDQVLVSVAGYQSKKVMVQ